MFMLAADDFLLHHNLQKSAISPVMSPVELIATNFGYFSCMDAKGSKLISLVHLRAVTGRT